MKGWFCTPQCSRTGNLIQFIVIPLTPFSCVGWEPYPSAGYIFDIFLAPPTELSLCIYVRIYMYVASSYLSITSLLLVLSVNSLFFNPQPFLPLFFFFFSSSIHLFLARNLCFLLILVSFLTFQTPNIFFFLVLCHTWLVESQHIVSCGTELPPNSILTFPFFLESPVSLYYLHCLKI